MEWPSFKEVFYLQCSHYRHGYTLGDSQPYRVCSVGISHIISKTMSNSNIALRMGRAMQILESIDVSGQVDAGTRRGRGQSA